MYNISNIYTWNPWYGCKWYCNGCNNCENNNSSKIIVSNSNMNFPIRKEKLRNKNGVQRNYPMNYVVEQGSLINTCTKSDFFIQDADACRTKIWDIIHERYDCLFIINTHRINRINQCLPANWLDGYSNVIINAVIEDNDSAWERLPLFIQMPIKHKGIVIKPMLEKIDITPFICGPDIQSVIVYGDSNNGEILDFDWVEDIAEQCRYYNINFYFEGTGSKIRRDGKIIHVSKRDEHGLAEFYNLNLEYTSVDWKKNAKELELQLLAENANKIYRRLNGD